MSKIQKDCAGIKVCCVFIDEGAAAIAVQAYRKKCSYNAKFYYEGHDIKKTVKEVIDNIM